MDAALEPQKEQEQCRCQGGEQARKVEKELVDIVVGNDLVQDHQQQDASDIERVFAFLEGGEENGFDQAHILQDQEKDDGDDHRKDEDGHDIAALVFQGAVRGHNKEKDGSPNGNEQGIEDVGNKLLEVVHQISFLSLATGMPNCSLYLATVRLAMG